ncbi:vomeronasal type-2 receptor 26-like isoform X2 [Dendropsophus ebraccatus]
MFAVEEINGQQEILPNITLGYILHDSCETERAALHQALCIISGRETMAPNYDCFQKGRLVGIVGHRYSSVSASIASVTGIYRYPQISYGSRDSVFNDDVNLLSFHRTFPGQRAQHDALIQLLKHFGWTWVGIFSSVGDSSQRSSLELKERLTQSGICVEFLITVNNAFIQLNYYLKRIHLFTPGGEEIYFTKDGHFRTKFDILNYILFDNGSSQRNTVGYYRETTDGFQLEVNDSAIWWNPHFSQTPQSTCSKRCLLGYHRIPIKGHQKCCYTCVPCPKGQIANTTDMEKCITCPEDEWSSEDRKACVPRATEFLSHGDTLSLFLIVFSLLFCLLTAAILGIFIKYKDTAIVKANNQTLSFILLLSLLLSFLCPLLFIGRPSEMSCLLRQVAFGNIFTVAVSSVLAKTVTVVFAFRATKPDRTQRRWLGRNLAIYVLLLSSFGEFLICVFWLIISPPFPEYNTWVEVGKIILQCNEGSAIAFYVAIGYIGFLAVLSFIVAFLARKLPDTFNEAQYITFSMLVFCSVWISFIPAYLSTKGKYMVVVEVFAIVTSSAGLLSCIFIPKCYIILLRPEMNVRCKLNSENKIKLNH